MNERNPGLKQQTAELVGGTAVRVLFTALDIVEPILRISEMPSIFKRQWSNKLGYPAEYYLIEDKLFLVADILIFPSIGMAVGNYLIREDIPMAARIAIGFLAGSYVVASRAITRDKMNNPF